MSDGSIRIKTKLETSKAAKSFKDLENMARRAGKHLQDAFKSNDTFRLEKSLKEQQSLIKQNEAAIKDEQKAIEKAKKEIEKYQKLLDNIDSSKGVKEIEAQLKKQQKIMSDSQREIDKYQKKLDNLDNSKSIRALQQKIDAENEVIANARQQLEKYYKELELGEQKLHEMEAAARAQVRQKYDPVMLKVNPKLEKYEAAENLVSNPDYMAAVAHEDEMANSIREYECKVNDAENAVAALKVQLGNAKAEQENGLQAKMQEYKSEIDSASASAEQLKQKLADVKREQSESFTGKIFEASEEIKTSEENISFLSKAIEKAKAKTSSLSERLERVKNKCNMSNSVKKTSSAFKTAAKNANNFGDKVSSAVSKGMKRMAKLSLAIFSVRSAFVLAKRASSEYLQSNEQLAGQVQGIWNALSQAIGPVVQTIVGWIVTLVSYINSFIKSLTGIDFVAKGNAAALDKQAKAAGNVAKETKKANRQLASFDEMNVLSKNDTSDSGAGGSGNNVAQLELAPVNIDGIKDMLLELFEPIANAWDNYGDTFVESFKKGLNEVWELITSIGGSFKEVWLNGTGELTCSLILKILTKISDIIGNIAGNFKKAWNTAGLGTAIVQHLWDIFNSFLLVVYSLCELFEYIVSQIDWVKLLGIIESISGAFADISKILSEGLKKIVDSLINQDYSGAGKALSDTFKDAIKYISNFISSIDWFKLGYDIAVWIIDGLKIIIEFLFGIDWFGLLVEIGRLCIEGIVSGLAAIGGIVVGIFESMIDAVCDFLGIHSPSKMFENIGGYILEGLLKGLAALGKLVGDIFKGAWNIVCSIFDISNVKKFFESVLKGIKNVFSSIPNWFKEKFSAAWQAVKNVFSAGGKVFDGIKDGILNGLKTVINALISGINRVIKIPFDGINWALQKIHDINILGMHPFDWIGTISVPQIPKLAKGGIVNNPGLGVNMGSYIAGERGPEAIVPLKDSTFVKTFAQEVASQIKTDQPTTIILQIGDKEFYRWFINMKRKYEFVMNGG